MPERNQTAAPTEAAGAEPSGGPVFEPYESPAGGWGALQATAHGLPEQGIALKGSGVLLAMTSRTVSTVPAVPGLTRNTPARSNYARMEPRQSPLT
jgi:hypothetical protein